MSAYILMSHMTYYGHVPGLHMPSGITVSEFAGVYDSLEMAQSAAHQPSDWTYRDNLLPTWHTREIGLRPGEGLAFSILKSPLNSGIPTFHK